MRRKARDIKEVTPEIKKLAEDMIETMVNVKPEGLGLAGPQVGISKNIFVAQTTDGPRIFINPEIIKKSKETETMEEGCLSLPGVWLNIKRAKAAELEYLDAEGKISKIKAEGLFARILQHEIDHLKGILIIDKVNFWQKLTK